MKKLVYPQEIEVWYVLPLLRKYLSIKLVEKGLSQKEVSKLMGLTQAAVSQYKKDKRASEDLFGDSLDEDIEFSANNIIKKEKNVKNEIMNLTRLVKEKGILCKIHNMKMQDGEICLECQWKK
jgi:uncharacterized protein